MLTFNNWKSSEIDIVLAVADPGFSRGGAPIPELGLFCQFFAENCMKMKEFGSGGARPWRHPLDLSMACEHLLSGMSLSQKFTFFIGRIYTF